MGWFCAGFGFGEIDLAYTISAESGLPVADLFAQAQQGLGWGEIMQTAGIVRGQGRQPDQNPGDDAEEEREGGVCAGGEAIQPHAEDLAAESGAPYADIIAWFCQGYGLGEIKLAYAISAAKSVPISEVFAQKATGLGWGEILKAYDLQGKPASPGKPDKPPKPEDHPSGQPEAGKPADKGHPNKDK
jgi:hypothetical protein